MSPDSLLVFMNGYLDPAQVAIGRLVLEMKSPGQNFCPHGTLDIKEGDVSKATFTNLKTLANAESSSGFQLALKSPPDLRYKLERIIEDDEVKKWLEKVIPTGSDVYMVVGLHTLQDASISLNREASQDIGARLQAPITEALVPGISAAPGMRDVLDVKIEAGHTSQSALGASFVTPGERIVVVQYQKVDVKMVSSKGIRSLVDKGLKKKTTWQALGAARGDTHLDTFEVTLAAEIDVDEITEDGGFEALSVVEGGEVFVILT